MRQALALTFSGVEGGAGLSKSHVSSIKIIKTSLTETLQMGCINMAAFNDRAFADAAGVFNVKSEKDLMAWFSWKAVRTVEEARPSRFFDMGRKLLALGGFDTLVLPPPPPAPPAVAEEQKPFYSYFLTSAAKKPVVVIEAPVVEAVITEAPAVAAEQNPRRTLMLKAKVFSNDMLMKKQAPAVAEPAAGTFDITAPVVSTPVVSIVEVPAPAAIAAAVAEEIKPRKTLTLKTKVELPAITSLTRASNTNDLAAAFKAEMQAVTERKAEIGTTDLHAAFAEKRARHPLSNKSWKELIAEAETVAPKEQKGPDLTAAFRREMQAMIAAEQKGIAAPAPAPVKPVAKPAAVKPRLVA